MPAPCPGNGPAAPRPSLPAQNFLSGGTLTEILVSTLNLPAGVAALLVFAAAQAIDWTSLCNAGPPTFQVFTADDVHTIETSPWNVNEVSFQKLLTLIEIGAWYYGCDCTGAATPAPPAIPPLPPDAPTPVQPTPPAAVSPNCSDVTNDYTAVATGVNGIHDTDVPQLWLPGTATTNPNAAVGAPYHTVLTVPPGVTTATFDTTTSFTGSSTTAALNFQMFDASFANLGSGGIGGGTAGQQHHVFTLPTTCRYYGMVVGVQEPTTLPVTFSTRAQLACSSSGSIVQPCCPPDPTLTGLLQQVLNLENAIYQLVQGKSAKYARGTVHDNVSGTGTITVSGLFGVLVEILTGVPTSPQLPGVPPYQWDVGWLSVLTPDGFIDEKRITRQAQVWASALIPYANTLGYQISAGHTVRLTELVPA